MSTLDEIRQKHQYVVWEKVGKENAEGLLGRLKEQLLTENHLTAEDELSFIAYALKNKGILVLTADKG
jgi:hypothetical protein